MDEITKKETAKIGAATKHELKNLGLDLVEGKRYGNDTEAVIAKDKNGKEWYIALLLSSSAKTEEVSNVIAYCPTYNRALLISSAIAVSNIVTGICKSFIKKGE